MEGGGGGISSRVKNSQSIGEGLFLRGLRHPQLAATLPIIRIEIKTLVGWSTFGAEEKNRSVREAKILIVV